MNAKPRVSLEAESLAAERVVAHVEGRIASGELKPGDRLPSERELARQVGVSRPSVRAGLRFLAALGVVESRHGAGTFITAGPARLSTDGLRFMAALHGFTRDEMFEARRVLEAGAAGLAAERASGENLAGMAEEVAGLFASLDDPHTFLRHDMQFHRAVAVASHNPVLAALVEMVSTVVYETRRRTVERAQDLKESAAMHRRIYGAIREGAPDRARQEMNAHLNLAQVAQASEPGAQRPGEAPPAAPEPNGAEPRRASRKRVQ